MARVQCRPAATSEQMLTSLCTQGTGCGQPMWVAYHTQRTITALQGICLAEKPRLYKQFKEQRQVILAIDGLQPDVGHEVLWVFVTVFLGKCSWLEAC